MKIKIDDEMYKEAWKLLDLIVAEFNRDPMSVQCFDLKAIVYPARLLIKKQRKIGLHLS